jgi:Mn-dependent DtxR family transcriptional regulator
VRLVKTWTPELIDGAEVIVNRVSMRANNKGDQMDPAQLDPKERQLLMTIFRAPNTALKTGGFVTPQGFSASEVDAIFLRLRSLDLIGMNSKARYLTASGKALAERLETAIPDAAKTLPLKDQFMLSAHLLYPDDGAKIHAGVVGERLGIGISPALELFRQLIREAIIDDDDGNFTQHGRAQAAALLAKLTKPPKRPTLFSMELLPMELNTRQSAYLMAAFAASPYQAFDWRDIGAKAEPPFDAGESHDLCYQLQKRGFLTMEEGRATLTPDGREEARRIKAEHRQVRFSAEDARFVLLAYAAAPKPGDEFTMMAVAESAGIESQAEQEAICNKFVDAGVFGGGTMYGTEAFTPFGYALIPGLRKMRLLIALYEAVKDEPGKTASLPELGVPFGVTKEDALKVAQELSAAGLVTGRFGGVCGLTEPGREKVRSMIKETKGGDGDGGPTDPA